MSDKPKVDNSETDFPRNKDPPYQSFPPGE